MNKDHIVELIKQNTWHKYGHWVCSVLSEGVFLSSLTQENLAQVGIPFVPDTLLEVSDNYLFLKSDYQKLFDFFSDKIHNDPNYLGFFTRTLDQVSAATLARIDTATTLETFFESLKPDTALGISMVPLDAVIEGFISTHGFDSGLTAHVYPKRRAHMIDERVSILELRIRQSSGADIVDALNDHARRFGWMNTVNWRFPQHDATYYREAIEKIELQHAYEELQELTDRARVEKGIEDYLANKDARHRVMLDTLRGLMDAKMLNWDVVGLANNKLRELLAQDPVLRSIEYLTLVSLTPIELLGVRDGTVSMTQALELATPREQYRVSAFLGGSFQSWGISKAESDAHFASLMGVTPDVTELKGAVGYPGKATGRVQIIDRASDSGKMVKGNILVCPMTNPDFMPAVIKASALVTDQGGLLCHAAIVARELKKPCVIGTKIATQVFKDGDLVEVDAEKGIVRKV